MGIFRFFEIDGALVFTLLGRFSGSLFGLITLWFVYNFISPLETGFYFTFASILALQIIFELGMFQVIMQFASHEMPLLSYRTLFVFTLKPPNLLDVLLDALGRILLKFICQTEFIINFSGQTETVTVDCDPSETQTNTDSLTVCHLY